MNELSRRELVYYAGLLGISLQLDLYGKEKLNNSNLSRDQNELLKSLIQTFLPEGALDQESVARIIEIQNNIVKFAVSKQYFTEFGASLHRLDDISLSNYKKDFSSLTADKRVSVLSVLTNEEKGVLQGFKYLVILIYGAKVDFEGFFGAQTPPYFKGSVRLSS